MGFFSSISSLVKTSTSKVASAINTGGGTFKSPILSVAGQKERLSNVATVLKQSLNPVSSSKPVVNTNLVSNKTAKSVLSFVASNPYTTALAVTLPISSAGRSAVASTIGKLSTKTKVIGTTAGLLTAGAIAKSEKSRVSTINTLSAVTPESIVKLGGSVGTVIENPTMNNIQNLASENKVTAGVLTVGLLLATGGAVVNTLSNISNTQAIKENTKTMQESILTPEVSPLNSSSLPSGVKQTKKKKKKTKKIKKKKIVKKKSNKKKYGNRISTKSTRTKRKRKRKTTSRKSKNKTKRGKK